MQIWTDHTGTVRELRLTVGIAWRVLKHFPAVDVLGNPEQVDVLLNRPDYLLPLAVGMGAAPGIDLAQCENLADDLDGPAYASLLKAVRDALTDFFQEPTKSRLLEIRALTAVETERDMQTMRDRVNGRTGSASTGLTSVSNGPDSSALETSSTSPRDSSTSCSAGDRSDSGSTPPA